jgi:hypothetical protein
VRDDGASQPPANPTKAIPRAGIAFAAGCRALGSVAARVDVVALLVSKELLLDALLLGDDVSGADTVAAVATCQTCAPGRAVAVDAVQAEPGAVAVAEMVACDPISGWPFAAVTLIVEAAIRARSLAQRPS